MVVTKTINNELLKYITSVERDFHSQEQHSRRECLDVVSIPSRLSTTSFVKNIPSLEVNEFPMNDQNQSRNSLTNIIINPNSNKVK